MRNRPRETVRPSRPDQQVMRHSDWRVRRRFSTRSLPSLALLEEALTDLKTANAIYSSDGSGELAERLLALSSP